MAIAATVIFVVALGVIAADWLHRTIVALAGAAIFVLLGVLDVEQAVEAISWETLGLLVGMMIIVALTDRTGVFTYLAIRAAQLSNGRPFRLVLLLAVMTGVMSAFLDNLTAILLVVPITLLIADQLRISPVPLVLIEIVASNIGGTATLIGDPPNIMIGSHVPELGFVDFIVNLAPVSIVILLVVVVFLYFFFRRRLRIAPERTSEIAKLDPMADVRDAKNVKRSLAVLVGTVVLFFAHSALDLEPVVVALVGATVMLLVTRDRVEEALERVEWSTIFFFVALFVMVGGLVEQGVIADVADAVSRATDGNRTLEGVTIMWGAAAGSAAVDNIPFTAAMIPVVDELQAGDETFFDGRWWALALGACLGGNATLIAAAANVAATGVLGRTGNPVSFGQFLRMGIPVTLLSLVIAMAYLLVFQF